MAKVEKEYVIPLRKEWLKSARHKRAKKAIRAVKEFLAQHMRAEMENIKVEKWLNQFIWKDGEKNPPAKVKVKVTKDEKGIVRVELLNLSEKAKKIEAKDKAMAEKHKKEKVDKKKEEKTEHKAEDKKEEKTEEEKAEEKILKKTIPAEEISHKEIKHETQPKPQQHPVRTALKK